MIDSTADVGRLTKPAKVRAAFYHDGKWTEAGTVTIPAGTYFGPGPLPP